MIRYDGAQTKVSQCPIFLQSSPQEHAPIWTGGADSELWPREQAAFTFDFKAHPQ